MLDARFWNAIDRLVAADDAGEDVAGFAQSLLDQDEGLAAQLDEAVTSLDASALGQAARMSDGASHSEDAIIAVACAVIMAGPVAYADALGDRSSLARSWDLSRGDLLLFLNPGLALGGEDVATGSSLRRYTISVSIGDSEVPWPRRVSAAVVDHQCKRQEKSARWMDIYARHDVEHVLIHLRAAPQNPRRVAKPYVHHAGVLETNVRWETPESLSGLPGAVRMMLDTVATRLES